MNLLVVVPSLKEMLHDSSCRMPVIALYLTCNRNKTSHKSAWVKLHYILQTCEYTNEPN